jgi:hypothetical protein
MNGGGHKRVLKPHVTAHNRGSPITNACFRV